MLRLTKQMKEDIRKIKEEDLIVCQDCGETDIVEKMWVDTNSYVSIDGDAYYKYDGDIEDGEEFMKFVLNNVRADHENQTLTYIDAQGNNFQIGIDDHRLAGRGEKMAGRFGLQLANKLKEMAERE